MRVSIHRLRSLLVLVPLLFFVALSSRSAVAQETPTIGGPTRDRVISTVASIMREKYVHPEEGERMATLIVSRHEQGAYDSCAGVKEFCSAVTSDLRTVNNDRHIFVFYSPEEAREVAAYKKLLPADEIREIEEKSYERSRRENFGFRKIEILRGNVGYLNLTSFPDIDDGAETAVAAMGFLSNVDAVIVDLRENGGGAGLVSFLSSYFFTSEQVHLSSAYFRESDSLHHSHTLPYVPGTRLPDVDLYVLTSGRTFSAAEDFAYSLQQLERAVVVGERTKGGAHPVDVLIVEGSILTQVPIGESVNPITKTNWEGVGVQPDVEVPAEQALAAAHLLALRSLLGDATEQEVRDELASLIDELEG